MATRKTKSDMTPQIVIEYLQSVQNLTADAKTLSYINMAIARQQKLARS